MKGTGRRARIVLLFVGRSGDSPFEEPFADYAARISRYEPTEIRRVRPAGGDDEDAIARESRALVDAAGETGALWLFDPRGRLLDTPAFAGLLARDLEERSPVTFAVGGAGGLDDAARERASRLLSLSPLTFPHALARVLVAEQVFRALTLRERVPYHK